MHTVRVRRWHVLMAALALWVLAANVHGDHRSVRVKLLRQPQEPQAAVSLPLAGAREFTDPYVVLIYRVRNDGPSTVAISATLDGEVVGQSLLNPGESSRVDLALPRSGPVGRNSHLILSGPTPNWVVDSAELANIHGFTRGPVEFLVLPRAQPFAAPPLWLLGAWGAWGLFFALSRRPAAPRWVRWLHLAACALVALLFGAAAMAPAVSTFRVVLAPHTFLGALLVVAAPQLLGVFARTGLWTVRRAVDVGREIASRREQVRAAAARVPWLRVILVTAFVLYAVVLWRQVGAFAGGADSSGYLNAARLIAEGSVTTAVRHAIDVADGLSRNAYEPLGLRVLESGELAPSYPIGLSLMIAAMASVAGWDLGPDLVMVLHALGGVMLTFWLARECGFTGRGAAIAALVLAASPVYLFMSLTLMSDTPALAWVTAAVLLAWRSRSLPGRAVAAGAVLGVAVLIRPTNILALVPIALSLGASPRRWLLLVAGGAPSALFLAVYNLAVYGTVVTSGYDVDYGRLFGFENVGLSLRNYGTWLPVLLTPLGVLILGLPALLRQAPRLVLMLLSWCVAFAGFYAFYYHTHETWWYLRFLLPAFPPLIVGSLWVGRAIVDRFLRAVRARGGAAVRVHVHPAFAAALVAVMIFAHHAWWDRRFGVLETGRAEHTYIEVADWARKNLPANAAVLAMQVSGSLFYYTDFPVLRWDHLNADDWNRVHSVEAAGSHPLYAILFPFEIDDLGAFRDRVPGNWVKVGTIEHVTVWQLKG